MKLGDLQPLRHCRGVIFLTMLTIAVGAHAQTQSETQLQLGDTVTLSFRGPKTSETSKVNPFTDYRLRVTFACEDESKTIRGFYAADGDAAQSDAESGNVWQVRFTPEKTGTWEFSASLRQGDWIAIDDDADAGRPIELNDTSGSFEVADRGDARDLGARDFRRHGRLQADGHYYRFSFSGNRWMKGGTNSPENLLANIDFDDTYRMAASDDEGEAKTTDAIHRFEPHVGDWNQGDPTWRDGKGKSLVGAVNYLASVGMNSIYFLTMNIGGDGKDVWPYIDPADFTRFDCSKLDQWEILFSHMQQRGMAMHVITQETENELLLDDGNTDRYRKLYYRELIARFSHHLAIVWNLGEENGPANFSPNGQSPVQQKAMADYLKTHDPYNNTVLIHTHAADNAQDDTLPALLGHGSLDGLSLQVGQPKKVHERVLLWRAKSAEAGHRWAISMDEIGPADTGAVTDDEAPEHEAVRGPVLWGSLLGGASGVEWYFGYKHPHNDLGCEDWRSRDRLWKLTSIAIRFFQEHLPFWEMQPHDDLLRGGSGYVFAKPSNVYAVFRSAGQADAEIALDMTSAPGTYQVRWLNPRKESPMQAGTQTQIDGGRVAKIGYPPTDVHADWVALVKNTDADSSDEDGQR